MNIMQNSPGINLPGANNAKSSTKGAGRAARGARFRWFAPVNENLIAGRDVEPAFSWGFFDRLLLIVTERVGELVVVFGDQIDIALVLDRGDRRLQRVIELGKCFLLVAGRHFLVGLNLRNLGLDDGIST